MSDTKDPANIIPEEEKRTIRDGMLCTRCMGKVVPKTAEKGSMAIEIVLWLFFFLPGLIYSIWRRTNESKVCPACTSPDLVPFQSERAKSIFGETKWRDISDLQKKYLSEQSAGGWEV